MDHLYSCLGNRVGRQKMDKMKTPIINAWGFIDEIHRMDGPSFVDNRGGEHYSTPGWCISINKFGRISFGLRTPIGDIFGKTEWTDL